MRDTVVQECSSTAIETQKVVSICADTVASAQIVQTDTCCQSKLTQSKHSQCHGVGAECHIFTGFTRWISQLKCMILNIPSICAIFANWYKCHENAYCKRIIWTGLKSADSPTAGYKVISGAWGITLRSNTMIKLWYQNWWSAYLSRRWTHGSLYPCHILLVTDSSQKKLPK